MTMPLFSDIEGHDTWGWLSEEEQPWRILSTTFELGIFQVASRMARDEESPCQTLNDADLSKGGVFVHQEAKVHTNVRFEGPVYVEEGAEIRHGAYIRPGTYISKGCVIGHCTEIKNSLMLPFSKAPHFNYVGDSILGNGTNIGAGVKLSNVRFDRRNILVQIENNQRIDSQLKKFGAMVGDRSEIGCNVVTNPGSIIPPQSAIPPNTVVSGYWNF